MDARSSAPPSSAHQRLSELLHCFPYGGLMTRRAILAFVTLIALSQTATAGVPLFGHVSCAVVRFYVAKYSEVAAETWARGHGASAADIEAARRCLHGTNVQTASSTMRSQVIAPATVQERAQNEPVETHPNQDALHVASVQAHPDDPKSDIDGDKPGLDGSSPPNDIEDRSAAHASHEMKDHPVSDGKTSTLLRRHAHVHHAGSAAVARHGKWFKRLWDHLAWPRQFRVAFLHFRGSRQ